MNAVGYLLGFGHTNGVRGQGAEHIKRRILEASMVMAEEGRGTRMRGEEGKKTQRPGGRLLPPDFGGLLSLVDLVVNGACSGLMEGWPRAVMKTPELEAENTQKLRRNLDFYKAVEPGQRRTVHGASEEHAGHSSQAALCQERA